MNTNELIINGKDAWTTYRVKMGYGFLDALEADADNKSYITNEVRTEHGTRVVPIRPKKAERSITLEFVIVGRDHSDYNKRVKAFDALMDNGFVTIQVPKSKDDIYNIAFPNLEYDESYTEKGDNLNIDKGIKKIERNKYATEEEKENYINVVEK